MKNQISAGGVVFRKRGAKLSVCLIARDRDDKRVWCLPKGHVEQGEDLDETAIREVREETGIWGFAVEPIRKINYQFYEPLSKKQIFKTVHFFLIRYVKGSLEDHDDEVAGAKWFSMEDALKRAEYKGERDVLRDAKAKLERLV